MLTGQCPAIPIAVQISEFKRKIETIFIKSSSCYQLEIFRNMIGPRSPSWSNHSVLHYKQRSRGLRAFQLQSSGKTEWSQIYLHHDANGMPIRTSSYKVAKYAMNRLPNYAFVSVITELIGRVESQKFLGLVDNEIVLQWTSVILMICVQLLCVCGNKSLCRTHITEDLFSLQWNRVLSYERRATLELNLNNIRNLFQGN